MNADRVINILATITLIQMMVTIGLGVAFADVLRVATNRGLLVRAALANYLLVPAVTVLLLVLFRAQPFVAVGFLIAAVCPGAPYGPPLTGVARGNVTAAVGLMVILAGSSAVVAPILLRWALPIVTGEENLTIDVGKIAGTLLVSQLLPLGIGLALRHRQPTLANRLRIPMSRLSLVLNLTLLGFILAVQGRTLAEIRLTGYVGMFLVVFLSVVVGWLLGGSDKASRKSFTMSTSIRNVGLCLVIVTTSFGGTAAVPAATAFGLFQTVMMVLVAIAWGRCTSEGPIHTQSTNLIAVDPHRV